MEVIELPNLRPYQIDNVQAVQHALRRDIRVIDCMPTGAGKSTVAKYILASKLNREPTSSQSGNAVFAVHRRGLVDNASQTFLRDPVLPHGVVMSGRETKLGHKIQVASIDTMLAWYLDGVYKVDHTYDLICFDEAHSHGSKLLKFVEAHDIKRAELGLHPAFVLGLSATPQAKGLSNVYKSIVKGPSTQWLIDNEYLVPFRYFQAKHLGKLDKLKKTAGGFTQDSLKEAFDGLAGDLVSDWKELANGKPTVGFFSRLSHAEEACAMFRRAGVRAEYIDGDTPDDQRNRLFDGLNNGDYDYLCNVGIVDRGTDIPNLGCIQLATAVNSVQRLIQMLGRVARKPGPHKTVAICIDHGGSIARLQTFFEDDIDWTLQADKEKELDSAGKPVISCPQCGIQYRGGSCKACGYEPTPAQRKSVGLEFVAGELVEITRKEKTAGKKKTNEDIWIGNLYRAGKSGRTYKQAIGMSYSQAERQGTKFRLPARVEVSGKIVKAIPYGHPDGKRKVSQLYGGMFS
jgi:superfamily II DNA or RNA helicase